MGLLSTPVKVGVGLLDEAVDRARDLMFLHNTNANKLARQESMGGFPMPSIAVTQKDIPFEGFGDITLVGKPDNFDPKSSKLNQAFSADAYTVRAPRPLKIAKKGAGKAFDAKYGSKLKELGVYSDEIRSNLWDLESKADARVDGYDNVIRFFEDRASPLFLDEKGIKHIGGGSDLDKRRWEQTQIDKAKSSGTHQEWVIDKIDEFLIPDQWFVAGSKDSPSGRRKSVLKPYSADEVTKFMKKSAGRGGEGGMSTGSTGSLRASTTEQFKNLQGMRDMKGNLVSADDMAEFKVTTDSLLYDLQDAFKSSYKYNADGIMYRNEFNDFVKLSETKGVKAAADEIGFNPSKELVQELNEYKDMLRSGPTEYFESKPKRVVDFNEFAGAIIPKSTDKQTRGLLKRYGIRAEEYTDEASKIAARNKFKSEMFSNPVATAAAGLGGLLAISASDDSEAGVVNTSVRIAKEILNLRAQGRASEVTDEMMDAADPQYMFNNTPLPMDEASRLSRANAAGASTDMYHMTDKGFNAFANPSRSGMQGKGVYASSSPESGMDVPRGLGDLINKKDGLFVEGTNTMPLRFTGESFDESIQRLDPFSDEGTAVLKRFGLKPNKTYSKIKGAEDGRDISEQLYDSASRQATKKHGNQRTSEWINELKSSLNSRLKKAGYASTEDSYTGNKMAFNPENVRSKFARFDPQFSNLKNLSASNPVATTSAGLLANVTGQPSNLSSYMQGNTDAYLTSAERQYLQNKQTFESNFSDDTGWDRADILPFRVNEQTGDVEFATPEMIKGLLSGIYDIGQSKNTKINNPASLLELI